MAKCKYRKSCTPFQDGIADCEKCGYADKPVTKPRPATKRIKAWCIVRDEWHIDGFEAGNTPPKYFSSAYVPCYIVIDKKYLKGEKK